MRAYTTQKKLGHDAELAAAEIVRRAERGIGLAIRKGQEEGTILRVGQTAYRPGSHPDAETIRVPVSAGSFVPKHELSSTDGGIYDITDGVTDEQFDEAIEEAKAEGNLSRANVVPLEKAGGD